MKKKYGRWALRRRFHRPLPFFWRLLVSEFLSHVANHRKFELCAAIGFDRRKDEPAQVRDHDDQPDEANQHAEQTADGAAASSRAGRNPCDDQDEAYDPERNRDDDKSNVQQNRLQRMKLYEAVF